MYQERGEVILMCLMNYSLFLLFILILYLNFRGKANFERCQILNKEKAEI